MFYHDGCSIVVTGILVNILTTLKKRSFAVIENFICWSVKGSSIVFWMVCWGTKSHFARNQSVRYLATLLVGSEWPHWIVSFMGLDLTINLRESRVHHVKSFPALKVT